MTATLDPRIQQLGRELLAASPPATSLTTDWLLSLMMHDPDTRLNALRFVDVLPTLTDDASLLRHLKEYHLDTIPLPGPKALTQFAFSHAPQKLLAATIRRAVTTMAHRFIAGHTLDTITAQLLSLQRQNLHFTLDLLGETTVSETEADAYQKQYFHLLENLTPRLAAWKTPAPLHLSIKLSSLYSQMNPAAETASVNALKQRLRPILQQARTLGAFITFDMEQYSYKNLTLRTFQEILLDPDFADWPDLGIAIQAYLRDTPQDLETLITLARQRNTPFMIRLVRGAYWDFETTLAHQNGWPVPVWLKKSETDLCYENALATLLRAHPHLRTAVATHNFRSLAVALAHAEALALPPSAYEFQLLYGMADEAKRTLAARGHTVRVYTPFGELLPGMSYFVRRLLENTASQSFLRLAGLEQAPPEELLAPPPALPTTSSHLPQLGFHNESPHRFTTNVERSSFQTALTTVQQQLPYSVPLLINNHPITTDPTNSFNPANTRQQIGRISTATPAHVTTAITAAQAAFPAWSALTFKQRAAHLQDAADRMSARRDTLAAWEVFETAKPWREADADVCEAIDFLRYYAHQALQYDTPQNLKRPGESNLFSYHPRGPSVVIGPWNFPLAIITGMTAAALVTGNTVLLKPAPQSPITAALLVNILLETNLPPGTLNFLPGPDTVGQALVSDPRIHLIAFTGSEAVGKSILHAANTPTPNQTHLKHVLAEMGGKNAIIVDDDADLDEAILGIIDSAFAYAGQKCSACSRVIVVGNFYQDFLTRLAHALHSLPLGDPSDPATLLGPVIDATAQQRILTTIEKAQATTRLLAQLTTLSPNGHYVPPTIFADVPPTSPLAQEEIFGPVLAILPAKSFEEAITLANNTRFALTGGVYSRSPSHLDFARTHFHVGNLYLNRKITGAIVGHHPFGGFHMSGTNAKAGGPDYLLHFLTPSTTTENLLRRGFSPDLPT